MEYVITFDLSYPNYEFAVLLISPSNMLILAKVLVMLLKLPFLSVFLFVFW